MPINIYTVTNHLESEGWKLISDSYKNLNTELEMICPQGHTQIISYGKWRKNPNCDICLGGKINKKDNIPDKKENVQRILALDAATNITGYAIFDNGILINFGIYKTENDKNTIEKIHEVKTWLINMIEKINPDFIGLENVQLQSFGQGQAQVKTFQTLANLQGVLIDTIFEACIDYDLAYASEWRKYCGVGEGIGRENKKKQAQDKVQLWYNQKCTQDEADAICIGKYFVGILKNSHSSWGEDI